MTEETQRPKHAGGRPTKYEPRFCDMVEEEMAKGYSLSAFCGIIGVARSTLNEWIAANPEFSEAVSRAKVLRLLQWERSAMKLAFKGGGSGPQATLTIFGLKNMGSDEWRDKSETTLSGPDGGPIQIEAVSARDRIASRLARISAGSGTRIDPGEPE